MVILRQILAVCLVLIASEVLFSKISFLIRYFLFVLLLVLALSMHYSAFIGIVILIIKHISFNKTVFLFSTLGGIVLFFSNAIFYWLMDQIGDFIVGSKLLAKQYAYFSSQVLKESKYTMSGIYSFVPYLLTFIFAGLLLINWRIVITIRPGGWENRVNKKRFLWKLYKRFPYVFSISGGCSKNYSI